MTIGGGSRIADLGSIAGSPTPPSYTGHITHPARSNATTCVHRELQSPAAAAAAEVPALSISPGLAGSYALAAPSLSLSHTHTDSGAGQDSSR